MGKHQIIWNKKNRELLKKSGRVTITCDISEVSKDFILFYKNKHGYRKNGDAIDNIIKDLINLTENTNG